MTDHRDPRPFQAWLADFRATAAGTGISEPTLDAALTGLAPDPRTLAFDGRQQEYGTTFFAYLRNGISDQRIAQGRERMKRHEALLGRLERRYGVPGKVLVALWAMESDFGRHRGDFAVVRSPATLAHAGRRRDFFEGQLLAALGILDQGRAEPSALVGSWAGAMGQMQFMPTTFLDYGVDADGDGRIDIWDSVADALASAGHYLASVGWRRDLLWGREVLLPAGFDHYEARLANVRPLDHWRALGIAKGNGSALPSIAVSGAVILPAGKDGPAFLVYDNFRVLTEWNRSLFYALSVGHLADRLAGGGPLATAPPPDDRPLARRAIMAMQMDLHALGFDPGEPDGMIGFQTRQAVRDFQRAQGLPADAHATPALAADIARRARLGAAAPADGD